jgi:Tol biopolymer transport system component
MSRPVSFSPDGRELVFIRDRQQTDSSALLIAGSDGSNPRTLLEYRSPTRLVGSPAWSPDGPTIIFAAIGIDPSDTSNKVDLYSVGTSGGRITRIGDERWDIIYRIAWTGDGQGIVMIATRADESSTTRRDQIFYLSYPKGESRRLTTDGSRHQEWSIGVTKDDAIIAAAYNRSSQIWTMDRSGDAATAFQISRGSGDGRAGLATLPDGRLGFIARSGEDIDIWTMNSDGSDLKQVTSGISAMEELRADPRGRYLVFSGSKDKHNHLFRVDADGKNLRQLTFGEGHEIDSTISGDGNWVVFGPAQADTKQVLYRVPIDGGQPVLFGDAICGTPNFSPVGDMLSCVRDGEIVVLSGSDGKRIKTFTIPPYAAVHFGARWTPDGRNLVYIRNEKGFFNLWLQPLDGGSPRPLTNFSVGDIYNYAYSVDGTRLFVARGQQISDAILIRNFR